MHLLFKCWFDFTKLGRNGRKDLYQSYINGLCLLQKQVTGAKIEFNSNFLVWKTKGSQGFTNWCVTLTGGTIPKFHNVWPLASKLATPLGLVCSIVHMVKLLIDFQLVYKNDFCRFWMWAVAGHCLIQSNTKIHEKCLVLTMMDCKILN